MPSGLSLTLNCWLALFLIISIRNKLFGMELKNIPICDKPWSSIAQHITYICFLLIIWTKTITNVIFILFDNRSFIIKLYLPEVVDSERGTAGTSVGLFDFLEPFFFLIESQLQRTDITPECSNSTMCTTEHY